MGCTSSKNQVVIEANVLKQRTFKINPPIKLQPDEFMSLSKILKTKSDKLLRLDASKPISDGSSTSQHETPISRIDSRHDPNIILKDEDLIQLNEVYDMSEIERIANEEKGNRLLDIKEIEQIANDTEINTNVVALPNEMSNKEEHEEIKDLQKEIYHTQNLLDGAEPMFDITTQQIIKENAVVDGDINEEEKRQIEEDAKEIENAREQQEKIALEEAEKIAYDKRLEDEEDLELQKALMGSIEGEAQTIIEKYT